MLGDGIQVPPHMRMMEVSVEVRSKCRWMFRLSSLPWVHGLLKLGYRCPRAWPHDIRMCRWREAGRGDGYCVCVSVDGGRT
jgi:hypothetical protein